MQPEIDPTTGAYTGERISHLANAIWLRIMTPKGSWWGDPVLGSLLHTLTRSKALESVAATAEGMALDALRPLLTSGRAASIVAKATLSGTRLLLIVTSVDASGQRAVHDFTFVL